MTREELLEQLQPLNHDLRMRRMVEVGRRSVGDPESATVLDMLEQGSVYERMLALPSCFGSHDGARVLRFLSDPSNLLRGRARFTASHACHDEQVREAIERVPHRHRPALLRRLADCGRRLPVDAFLEELAGRDDVRLAELLPYGSPEIVTRFADPFQEQAGPVEWKRLARGYPALTAELLRRSAEATTELDARSILLINATLPLMARRAPDAAVDLLEAVLKHVAPSRLQMQSLVDRRPDRMAALLLRTPDRAPVTFSRVAHRLDRARMLEVVEHLGVDLRYDSVGMKRLAPEDRQALYEARRIAWRDLEGCFPTALVGLLPRESREAEARRHLALPSLATRPVERARYAAFLPWGEAWAVLEPLVRSPDAELRAPALSALVTVARYERAQLGEVAGVVRARKHEQDPVRLAMLTALAELPPSIWNDEHLKDLGQIFRDALDAADLSYSTASQVEHLVIALLPFHSEWATRWLCTVVRERGYVSLPDLGTRLTEQDVRRIAPALLPVLRSWEGSEREDHILNVARSFGRRLKTFDGLVQIVERVLRSTRREWTAESALRLIAQYRPRYAATLIPRLLEEDRSWGTSAPVYEFLHRRRQNLLTPYLGRNTYRGRFSTGRTRFLPPFYTGFFRWTPQQHTVYAESAWEVVGNRDRDTPAVLDTIRRIAGIPGIGAEYLAVLAEDRRTVVREAAVRALGSVDEGRGVEPLLKALEDDRARIAIYALRQAVVEMPPTTALTLLRGVPLEQVTVAEEVVRLLGELESEETYRELLALNGRNLHRDVRIALLRALWSHLEQDETWGILKEAAASPDAAIVGVLVRVPTERLSRQAQRRLTALWAELLGHADPVIRLSMLERCATLTIPDTDRALLPGLLRALASPYPDEQSAAARALVGAYAAGAPEQMGQVVRGLADNRRSLQVFLDCFLSTVERERSRLLEPGREVLAALAEDRLTARWRAALIPLVLPWGEVVEQLAAMAEADELHAEALLYAAHYLLHARKRQDAGELERAEETFGRSDDERLRRLALACLVARAHGEGWTEERVERLHRYRADSSALVAEAAQFTFPPEGEDAPEAGSS